MRFSHLEKMRLAGAAVLALLLLAQTASLFAPLDRFLSDKRYFLSDRAASGGIVFVAIDKQSLDAVGVWPWPRSVHAQITDRLHTLGAADIVFDIDFSTPSTPENDTAFAEAIARTEGKVTLPIFLQKPDAGDADALPIITAPIEPLAQWAWLAAVNVYPDPDGRVRRFPAVQQLSGEVIASVPASIAGKATGTGGTIGIDFGIDANSVPVISAAELLKGAVAPERVAGRTVVVGAYATELRDIYVVPKYGVMPGALLQIVAAETLLADRDITQPRSLVADIAIFAGLIILLYAMRKRGALVAGTALLLFSVAAEAVAAVLYLDRAMLVPTAFVHVSTVSAFGLRTVLQSGLLQALTQEARADARNMRRVLQKVVHDNFDAIVVIDEGGNVLDASEAVTEVFKTGPDVPERGVAASGFLPERLCTETCDTIRAARAGQAPRPEIRTMTITDADGQQRAIEYTIGLSQLDSADASDGGQIVACLTARDITERLTYEKRLKRLSDHDGMTGAWRRHAFLDAADSAFAQAAKGENHTIVAINLHRFKTVNIALGREAGNAVLRAVAGRLRNAERRVLGPARLGGDTFAILIGDTEDEADAQFAAAAIADIVTAPYRVGRGCAQVGVQAGVALWQHGADANESAEAVLDRAEMALDEARQASGARIVFFDKALAEQRTRARVIERDLWGALERNELSLHYQLQVGLADGAAHGAEALMRWQHPEIGPVSPAEFTAIAEANGSITALGRWAISTACREAATWPEPLSVAVNAAPQHFASESIVSDVEVALAESGLDPSRLTIELVESELLDTDEEIAKRIRSLQKLGVSIALDDFGTGYSGIGYLSRVPFDKLKIDRQFTMGLETNPEAEAIIRSVVLLGQAFNATVVCEGVETGEQERILRRIGCTEGQGYLYSRPLPADQFRALADGHQPLRMPAHA